VSESAHLPFLKAMKHTLILFSFLLTANHLSAQGSNRVGIFTDGGTNPGLVLEELKAPPPEVQGTYYLDEEWLKGSLQLQEQGSVRNLPMRYDLKNQWIEIKAPEGLKICPLNRIAFFVLHPENGQDTSLYMNAGLLKIPVNGSKKGILQVLAKGKFYLEEALLEIQPSYIPALDVGTNKVRVKRQLRLFMANSEGICELKKNKSACEACLGDSCGKFQDYLRKEKPNWNNKTELLKIVSYLARG
jgi:hypothetical protein